MKQLLVGLFLLLACSDESSSEWGGVPRAADFDGEECAACAMIVREQPAPRGQVVHANGEHAYFCSVADMLTYLTVASPHGEAVGVFVEVNDPSAEDPLALDERPKPWLKAEDAAFVVGIERARVMGRPVLVYRTRAEAAAIAERLDAETTDWDGLRAAN